MSATPMGPREEAHRDAIGAWIRGDWHGAARRLDDLLVQWPADLLALQHGHSLDFFVGDAANLRDRPGRSLAAIDPAHPHRGFVLGMQAFGLEESGHYEAAEAAGMAALATNPDDVWASTPWSTPTRCAATWPPASPSSASASPTGATATSSPPTTGGTSRCSTSRRGDLAEVLAIYDAQVHTPESAGVAARDARRQRPALAAPPRRPRHRRPLRGARRRLGRPSDAAPWYAFNDLHAVDRLHGGPAARPTPPRWCPGSRPRRPRARAPSNLAMTAEVGLPAAEAIVAFGEGRWDDVVDGLVPLRRTSQRFGGSHAQRDLLQRTLLEAAIRGGRADWPGRWSPSGSPSGRRAPTRRPSRPRLT